MIYWPYLCSNGKLLVNTAELTVSFEFTITIYICVSILVMK
jgi:hypothetical protein